MFFRSLRCRIARPLCHCALVNAEMPYEAILSMDGHLVTLNEWHHAGYEHAVVIYDQGGKLVKSYALDQLLPQTDMHKFPESIALKVRAEA